MFGDDGIISEKYKNSNLGLTGQVCRYAENTLCNDIGIGVVEAGLFLWKTIAYLFAFKESQTSKMKDPLWYPVIPKI